MKQNSSTGRLVGLVLGVAVIAIILFLSAYVLFWTYCLPRRADQQVANSAYEELNAQFPGVTFYGNAPWQNHIDIIVYGVTNGHEQAEIRDWLVGLKARRGWDTKIRLRFYQQENWIVTPGGGHRGPETLLKEFNF